MARTSGVLMDKEAKSWVVLTSFKDSKKKAEKEEEDDVKLIKPAPKELTLSIITQTTKTHI